MNAGGVVVRRIEAGEWREYRDLRLAALRDSPSAFGSTWARESALSDGEWQARARAGAASEERVTFVAVGADGKWVGLAGGYHPGEPPADAELVSVWVAPVARGNGIAGRLVDAVVDWAVAEHDLRHVGLWVTRGNAPAIALYEQSGFEPTGETQPLPSNPCRDELRMLKVAR